MSTIAPHGVHAHESPATGRPTGSLPAGSWAVDPVHSAVGFSVRHLVVATFRGQFDVFAGHLDVADDGTTRITGQVRTDSVAVKDEDLAMHLMSPDFFDSERHPEIRFTAEQVDRRGDAVELHGEITIRGVTRPLVLAGLAFGPYGDADGETRLGLQLEGVVDRTAFGLRWNQPLPGGGFVLSDQVTITAELQLVREST